MKIKLSILLPLLPLLATLGCKGNSPTGEKPPRYAKSVQVAHYDTTPRPINPNFEVFAREGDVPRPFKIIALVSRNAEPQDEGLMMTAIAWRAKQLGADGMIVLPPAGGGWSFSFYNRGGSGGSGEPIYRAHAIVWTAPIKP